MTVTGNLYFLIGIETLAALYHYQIYNPWCSKIWDKFLIPESLMSYFHICAFAFFASATWPVTLGYVLQKFRCICRFDLQKSEIPRNTKAMHQFGFVKNWLQVLSGSLIWLDKSSLVFKLILCCFKQQKSNISAANSYEFQDICYFYNTLHHFETDLNWTFSAHNVTYFFYF